jgi:nucleoside-diphosphate-sugar epimerase
LSSKPQFVPRRLLITGAAGFVGRHLVRCALNDPTISQIIACDLPDRSAPLELECRLQHRELDVLDAEACARLLQTTRPTHIIHAAAMTVGEERRLFGVNVHGTRNLLVAASAQTSVERFLLLSSSAVYDSSSGAAPCDEHHPLDLRTAYAQTKRSAEELLSAVPKHLSTVAARIGPCFGPGEAPGPCRPNVSIVARLLSAVHSGIPIRVSGEDYARDWTHLDDIHSALSSLLFALKLRHRIYNVSAGERIFASELLRCFQNHGLAVKWTDDADADLQLHLRDARKALVIDRLREATGFIPATTWQQRIATLITESSNFKTGLSTK